MAWLHPVLWAALLAMVISHAIKYLIILVKERSLDIKKHFWRFGFPSGHASFLTAMVVGVGLDAGWGSLLFALAAVFYLSYAFDLMLFRKVFGKVPSIPKHAIGHDRLDLVAGMVLGAIVALIVVA